jgi:hypothetical protein
MDGSFACQARKPREEASMSVNGLQRTALRAAAEAERYKSLAETPGLVV